MRRDYLREDLDERVVRQSGIGQIDDMQFAAKVPRQ